MTATIIKGIWNLTPYWVAFRKLEDPEKIEGRVPPGQSLAHEISVPLVNDGAEFSQKVLIVDVNQRWRAFVWQKGEVVYYRRGPIAGVDRGIPYNEPARRFVLDVPAQPVDAGHFVDGVPIPGVSVIGGDRILTINHYPGQRLTTFFDVAVTEGDCAQLPVSASR